MMGLLTGLRALPATVRGILLMVVAFAVFAATDSMAKFLVRDLTVAMVVWAYFTCQLVLLALVQGLAHQIAHEMRRVPGRHEVVDRRRQKPSLVHVPRAKGFLHDT